MRTEPLLDPPLPILDQVLLTERQIAALSKGKPFQVGTLYEAVAFVRAGKPHATVPRWLDRVQLVSEDDLELLRAGRRVAHPGTTELVPCEETLGV